MTDSKRDSYTGGHNANTPQIKEQPWRTKIEVLPWEFIDKLKSRGFRAASLSTYDFSTLYTTLPHNLIKDKLVDLFERISEREGSLYRACNDRSPQ